MKHFLILSTFVFAAVWSSGCTKAEEKETKTVVEVKVTRVESGDIQIGVTAPATVFPLQQASIASRMTAPIRELHARKGDTVAANAVIAVLESRDLLAQRDEARAAVADAQANLAKTSAGVLPTDLEHARGEVAKAEAALNQAQKNFDRRQQLFQQGAIPNRDLLVSETELSTAKTNYDVAKKSMDLLQNQSQDKDLRMMESRLQQANARLALIEAQLAFSDIRSPFSGTVTEQFMYPGDMAKPDGPIFTIADLSTVNARGQVPESEASRIRVSNGCTFNPADSSSTSMKGKVSVVNGAVDPATRTVEVWCQILNSKRELRSGAFGNLRIETGMIANGTLIPQTAVQIVEGTNKGSVLVVDSMNIAHKKDVELGEIQGGKAQIKGGLQPGETVIIEGGYGLPDGTEVRAAEGKTP